MEEQKIHDVSYFTKFSSGFKTHPSKWSLRTKIASVCLGLVYCVLGFFAIFSLIVSYIEKFEAKAYGAVFRLTAQAPTVFVSPFSAFLYVYQLRKYQEIGVTFLETVEFASAYSPKFASEKLLKSFRHAKYFTLFFLVVYPTILTGITLLLVYKYIMMYPDINYDQIHLTLGDQFFGFDKKTGFCFWYFQAIHTAAIFLLLLPMIANQVVPTVFFLLLEGQLRILIDSLGQIQVQEADKIRQKRFQLGGASTSTARNSDLWEIPEEDITTLEEDITNADEQTCGNRLNLRNCIIHHQRIMRLIRQAQTLLTPILFVKTFSAALTATNVALLITSGDDYYPMPSMVAAAVSFLANLALTIWYLAGLKDASYSVSTAAFSLVQCKIIPRKYLLIIMTRALHEVKFPCILTSSLSFKDFYKCSGISYILFVVAGHVVELLHNRKRNGTETPR